MGAATLLGPLLALSLTGCQLRADAQPGGHGSGQVEVTVVPGPPAGSARPAHNPTPPASPSPTGGRATPGPAPSGPTGAGSDNATSTLPLPVGACVGPASGHYPPVGCDTSAAYARVIARLGQQSLGADGESAACPAGTDFVLALRLIDARHPQGTPVGDACLRLLRGPHPGDPGGGAGVWLLPGDCVVETGTGEVRATPCDARSGHRPKFRIASLAPAPSACAPGTRQSVRIQNPGQLTQYGCLVAATP